MSTNSTTNGACATYDAFGRIVEFSKNSTYKENWYTQAGPVVMSGTTLGEAYLGAPGGGTFMELGGQNDYLHKDWLGNARLASLIAGQTVGADLAYAPYGEVYDFISGSNIDWMFTGDLTQLDSEYLFDTPNREFAGKNQGPWLSPDPAGAGWNQYAYMTNPLNSIDPSGLACYPLEKQIFGSCAGFGLLGDDNGGYTLDGVNAPPWLVMSLLNGGVAIECPNNDCSFIRTGPNGQFQQYIPYPTWQNGFTIYTGNGSWVNVPDTPANNGTPNPQVSCNQTTGICVPAKMIPPPGYSPVKNTVKWYLCGNGSFDNIKNYTLEGFTKGAIFGGIAGWEGGPLGVGLGALGGGVEGFFGGNAIGWVATAGCQAAGMYGPAS